MQYKKALYEFAKICPYILIGTCFLILANGGIKIGYTTQASYLSQIYQILDPSFLKNDFTINSRLTQHVFFKYICSIFFRFMGERQSLIFLNTGFYLFFAYALFIFSNFLNLNRKNYLILMLLVSGSLFGIGTSLEVNTIMGEPILSPSILAYGLGLLIFVSIGKNRFDLALFLLAFSLNLHLQIAASSLIIFSILLFSDKKKIFDLLNFRKIIIAFILAIPCIYSSINILSSKIITNWSFDSYLFRLGHHHHLRSMQALGAVILFFLLQLYLYKKHFQTSTEVSSKLKLLLQICTIVITLSLLHFFDLYFIKSTFLLKFDFLRATAYISLFGTASLLYFLQVKTLNSQWKNIIQTLLFVSIGLFFSFELYSNGAIKSMVDSGLIKERIKDNSSWINICTWVRKNGKSDQRYITPPDEEGFSYLSHRENIVEFKQPALNGDFVARWEERIHDLGGINFKNLKNIRDLNDNFSRRKYGIIRKHYDQLSSYDIIRIAKKYKATYAILNVNHIDSFEIMYSNSEFKLVKIL